jgi:hypothetical protein
MQVILRPIITAETESITAMLRDAEEGEERYVGDAIYAGRLICMFSDQHIQAQCRCCR